MTRTVLEIMTIVATLTLAAWAIIEGFGVIDERKHPAINDYRYSMTLSSPDGKTLETFKLFGEYTKRASGGGFFDDHDNGMIVKSNAAGEIRYYQATVGRR